MNTKIILIALLFTVCSCTQKTSNEATSEINTLKKELDSLKASIASSTRDNQAQIATFLTFQKGNAEEAMNYYMSLFDDAELIKLQRWEAGAPSKEGTVMHAIFRLNNQLFMCSDSPPVHDWDFTPAVSNYIDCKNEAELERLFNALSKNGSITMPLNNYGFSQKFGWVIDQFGISWQLNLK